MNGKNKCKILKDIRRKIAEDNDIAYVTSECKYQGDCSGTCPRCEAELRYLEEELAKRKNLGKTVAVAGIAAALVVSSTGCDFRNLDETAGSPPLQPKSSNMNILPGEVAIEESTEPSDDELGSEATGPSDMIMGDIALPEDSVCPD